MALSCSKVFYVEDTKIIKEQYLLTNQFYDCDIVRLERLFNKAGFHVLYEYDMCSRYTLCKYMVLSPGMIEYDRPDFWVFKRGGILKKRHVKHLKNTL